MALLSRFIFLKPTIPHKHKNFMSSIYIVQTRRIRKNGVSRQLSDSGGLFIE